MFFNYIMNNSYKPLIHSIPLSIANRTYDAGNTASSRPPPPEREAAKLESDVRKKDYAPKKSESSSNPTSAGAVNAATAVDANDTARSSFDGSRSSSPSPSAKPIDPEASDSVDFRNPAAFEPQQTIWLPRDTLDLALDAERVIAGDGICVTTEGASMDAKGHVDVSAAPPDQDRRSMDRPDRASVDRSDRASVDRSNRPSVDSQAADGKDKGPRKLRRTVGQRV